MHARGASRAHRAVDDRGAREHAAGIAARDRAATGEARQPMVTSGAVGGGARGKLTPSRHRVVSSGGLAHHAIHWAVYCPAATTVADTPVGCLPMLQIAQCWEVSSKDGGYRCAMVCAATSRWASTTRPAKWLERAGPRGARDRLGPWHAGPDPVVLRLTSALTIRVGEGRAPNGSYRPIRAWQWRGGFSSRLAIDDRTHRAPHAAWSAALTRSIARCVNATTASPSIPGALGRDLATLGRASFGAEA
jgi:hypothetical protein